MSRSKVKVTRDKKTAFCVCFMLGKTSLALVVFSSSFDIFWATVCIRPMLSVRCLSVLSVMSVLSVTFVHCGQTVRRIKIKLGVRVGL